MAERRLFDIPLVVLDTETTGLQPGLGDRVVEVGAIRFEKGRVVGEMGQLIQPGRPVDPRASQVNHIYDKDLVGAPSFGDIAGELLHLLDGAVVVAHNAQFDAGFLGLEFYLDGRTIDPERSGPVLPNPWLCTLLLARGYFHFGWNNLGHIARNLGVRMGRSHRALNDAYMTAEIFKRMLRQLERFGYTTVGDLCHAQGGAVYTPPAPRIYLPRPLREALSTGRRLRILYVSESGETNRVVTPRYTTEHRGTGYLIAFCHLRNSQRTFRIDRIFSAEVVGD